MVRVNRPRRAEEGQDLVEFAIVLPLLMLLVLGLAEMAVAVLRHNTLSNAAREGARVGIIAGATERQVLDTVEARALTLGLTDANVTVTFDDEARRVAVVVTYEHHLLTGVLLEIFGGNPAIPMRAGATMRRE
jgi:Flp pilus assembly protein TadG